MNCSDMEEIMTTKKTEQQAKEEILSLVKEYCDTYHNVKKPFQEGDRIPYASRVYDSEEMTNLVDSALEFWLTSGRYTDQFEKQMADYLGKDVDQPRNLAKSVTVE